jgi:hypothetical protein
MVCFSYLQVSGGLSQPTIDALSEFLCTTPAYSKKTKARALACQQAAQRGAAPSSLPQQRLAQRVIDQRNQF